MITRMSTTTITGVALSTLAVVLMQFTEATLIARQPQPHGESTLIACSTKPRSRESGQVRIQMVPIAEIQPAPENLQLYRPVRPDDPEVQQLADSIRRHGIQVPLVLSLDRFIISGHRRHVAAQLAGKTALPCRFAPIRRDRDHDRFLQLLRECNRQRVKSFDEVLREEIVSADPDAAYRGLVEYRRAKSRVNVATLEIGERKDRAKISEAKLPFLNAVICALNKLRDFWPVSERRVHYELLNDPPLRHASKPGSTYTNNKQSSKDLSDLITRVRVEGRITYDAIGDDTRPVTSWDVYDSLAAFIRDQIASFLCGYWRNLMQSQPAFVAVIGEKATLGPVIQPVLADYTIPFFLGRGFSSHPPMEWLRKQFVASAKEFCIVVLLSDHDPDGEDIGTSAARILRDEYHMPAMRAVKVALNHSQVAQYNLPESVNVAKKGGNSAAYHVRRQRFVEKYGTKVYELEALHPETLQEILRDTIESVIDREAFQHEVEQEKVDAAQIDATRGRVLRYLQECGIGDAKE